MKIMQQNKKLIYQVSKVLQLHLDSVKGYTLLSSKTHDLSLKAVFDQKMDQSSQFADKLRGAMALQGLDIHASASWMGLVFRAWVRLRLRLCANESYTALRLSLSAEKMLGLSYELLCNNKYLDYYFPLLKYSFLKQHAGLQKTREELTVLLDKYRAGGVSKAGGEPIEVLSSPPYK